VPDAAPGGEASVDEERAVACAACRHLLTRIVARTSVNGEHRHVCVNPSGIPYEIGCWSSAPGCSEVGAPEAFWSWFAGYTWQIAVCAACGTHLGWRFARSEASFYGLIVARVMEVDAD
jgi:hypothetical protein